MNIERATEFVRFILPALLTAGEYSKQVQSRVNAHAAKAGDTAFQQALSDADLSVQAFLEVVLLSRFPDCAFFSEEQDQSLNAKYFPAVAEWEVLLDPIDGTRAYLDGAEKYQIIITLRERSSIAAAICYMPRRRRCYAAIRGGGATVYSMEEMRAGEPSHRKIMLSDTSRRIVLFNAPGAKRSLESHFEVLDILEEYNARKVHHGFTELFEGTVAACIHPNPQLIDAGAISFIAQEAGATVTDWKGKPVHFEVPAAKRLSGILVSASSTLHDEIIRRLESLGRR